ncbi:methyltransferase type 11 [Gammaproteobacteria bacterium]|nr:methyltransferase type 11 [Gammaproteobacteria bacterium]MDB9842367.1 methyltransferase type 11 [Gammaproteobacteria bacterium]
MKEIKDKKDLISSIKPGDNLMLELGCGEVKHDGQSISIDLIDYEDVDIIGDIYEVLKLIPTASVKHIYSSHVFEHLENLPNILIEIQRILQLDGELEVLVPHFSNSFFYSDPTHTTFFGLYTFSYYFKSNLFKRSVPKYALIDGMELFYVKLIFRSFKPHYLSHAIRKFFQCIFNLSSSMQEVYEESFVNFISCYEVQFIIKKTQ